MPFLISIINLKIINSQEQIQYEVRNVNPEQHRLELEIRDGDCMVTALHEKSSFPLRISSANVTKSAVSCSFGQIY